ncbi:hypothetical protein J2Z77_006775 [Streptomyces avidinii]|uniref:Uncharacterized protein n=1 Tax=Streptomyces avidinii TaxID=1895 RepID=A0ABS4LFN9_STRAV|nr:hypothetical protein [Streptomyces avidinii]MBP2040918.1 hypothetical protein [Streptomyces avidinii]
MERRRRARHEGGMESLRSAGPANSATVTDDQFTVLEGNSARARRRTASLTNAGL